MGISTAKYVARTLLDDEDFIEMAKNMVKKLLLNEEIRGLIKELFQEVFEEENFDAVYIKAPPEKEAELKKTKL